MPETNVKVKLHFNFYFLIHCNILLSVEKELKGLTISKAIIFKKHFSSSCVEFDIPESEVN